MNLTFCIGGIKLNGKNWTRNYFKHSDLTNGAKIVYSMSAEPVTTRGTAPEAAPYSFSKEYKVASKKKSKK